MKKLFIAASLIIGMIAGAMVLSSFSEANNKEDNKTEITMNDAWKRVGTYTGESRDNEEREFVIWEKDGMCNSYYWTTGLYGSYDPDWHWANNSDSQTGALRKNRNGEWYAAYAGKNYYIDF